MVALSIVSLDKKRSKVLTDQDLAIVLYPGELLQFHIREGEEISEKTWKELLKTAVTPRAKKRVLQALTVSDKTKKQLEDLLKREGYPEESIEEAIRMAEGYHYLDDRAYGERYFHSWRDKKSTREITAKMQQKGFPPELVRELLKEEPVDEKGQIRIFLEKKGYFPEPGAESLDPVRYRKLMGMLARKGYSYDAVSEVLQELRQRFD